MHVTRSAPAVVLALASMLGCKGRSEQAHKVAPPVFASASAAPVVPIDPAFLTLARDARDAATKVASECELRTMTGEEHTRYYDHCALSNGVVSALQQAANALAGSPAPANTRAALFAEEIRLFTAWVSFVKDDRAQGALSSYQGTLWHYQGLAASWNALVPGESIPIDVLSKADHHDVANAPRDGGVLAWTRCDFGPCLVVRTR